MLDIFNNFFKDKNKNNENVKEKLKVDIKTSACVVLLEVAYSDDDFADEEKEFIIDTLKKYFGLSDQETDELIIIAERILDDDTNRWRYINEINNSFSREEKINLITDVWRLIYKDDRLDKWEDHLVHRLSKTLHIPHEELIAAKLKVIDS